MREHQLDRRRFLATSAATMAGFITMPSWLRADEGCDHWAAITAKWDRSVRPMLASRYHRLHHAMFHYVRNTWADMSAEQQADLKNIGWDAPRASLSYFGWDEQKPYRNLAWATTNGSGEDFLYYHRWMLAMVDEALAAQGVGPLQPWSGRDAIPAPLAGCADEAVPDFVPVFANAADPSKPTVIPWLQLRVKEMKSPAFFWNKMTWWQNDFRDPAYLKSMTLGELGARLESTVHNQMHVRWAAYPSNGMKQIRDEGDFRAMWDAPGYDCLFDEYSSHITPSFFKLHKWVDDRIEDWAAAQGSAVKRMPTPYGFDWFETGGGVQVARPWTGPWGFESIDASEEARRVGVLEQVTRILFPPAPAVAAPKPRRAHRDVRSLRDHIQ